MTGAIEPRTKDEATHASLLASVPHPDGGRIDVNRLVFPVGSSTGWHRHDGWQTGLVTNGALQHVTPQRTRVITAGEVLVEPPHGVHAARSVGAESAELVYVAHIPVGSDAATSTPAPSMDGDHSIAAESALIALGAPTETWAVHFAQDNGREPAEVLLILRANRTYTLVSADRRVHGCVAERRRARGEEHLLLVSLPAHADHEAVTRAVTLSESIGTVSVRRVQPSSSAPVCRGSAARSTLAESGLAGDWASVRDAHADAFERAGSRADSNA